MGTIVKHEQHNTQISIAKGLCILLMVVGHSGSPSLINNWLYFFHMPFFFFVSGYLLKDTYVANPVTLVKRRLKTLWWPYVKYGLIFLLLHNIFYYCYLYETPYTFEETLKKGMCLLVMLGHEELIGGFWFLRYLFCGMILTVFILHVCNRLKTRKLVSGGGGVWAIVTATALGLDLYIRNSLISSHSFRLVNLILLSSSFIVLGYCCSKSIFKFKRLIILFTTFIILCFFSLLNLRWGVKLGMLNINEWDAISFVFCYLMAIIGIIWVNSFSSFVENSRIGRILDFYGKNTMPILVWHMLSFKIISYLKILKYGLPISSLSDFPVIINNNSLWWIAYVLVGVFLPLFFDHILSKFKLRTLYTKKTIIRWHH